MHNLICVLDWGLGHASRSLALAARLEARGETVSWASSGPARAMLQRELPGTAVRELPAYAVRYPTGNMIWNVAVQFPRWLSVIWRERKALALLVTELRPDRIISDSRFGCYHRDVPSVFLTHQLCPLTGFAPATWLYRRWLTTHFTEFWVPDVAGPDNLSGRLSDPTGYGEVKYVGWLSRLEVPTRETKPPGLRPGGDSAHEGTVLLLLSGPEPARTNFENELIDRFGGSERPIVLVRGLPDGPPRQRPTPPDWEIHPYADRATLSRLLAAADLVICRSGYSSLMDLRTFDKRAELHPTPGQTEQVYLAERWKEITS